MSFLSFVCLSTVYNPGYIPIFQDNITLIQIETDYLFNPQLSAADYFLNPQISTANMTTDELHDLDCQLERIEQEQQEEQREEERRYIKLSLPHNKRRRFV